MKLPKVTLISIDTLTPFRSIKAMQYSMLQVEFANALIVTNERAFRAGMLDTIGGQGRLNGLRLRFVETGPRAEYERQIIEDLGQWVDTDYILFQEWDSAVMNPSAWNPEWLTYDFIGAPWPWCFNEHGYPPCDKSNCVGNGGFSLRTRKFATATRDIFREGSPDSKANALRCSDAWISRTIRSHLINRGLIFAPEAEAAKFSCENRFYAGQFGLHGKNTIAMNGLKWDFDWLI